MNIFHRSSMYFHQLHRWKVNSQILYSFQYKISICYLNSKNGSTHATTLNPIKLYWPPCCENKLISQNKSYICMHLRHSIECIKAHTRRLADHIRELNVARGDGLSGLITTTNLCYLLLLLLIRVQQTTTSQRTKRSLSFRETER